MRLIDANALKKTIGDLYGLPFEEMVEDFTWLKAIDNAPTVCGNNPKWCESCVSKGKCASTRPQGDLISREALKKAFEDTVCIEPMPYAFVKQIIDNAPTEPQVTVFAENASKEEIEDFKRELENVLERPKGEWKMDSIGVYCSNCHIHPDFTFNFCPNCGADMKGGAE